jgi:hypothetical protein
MPTFMRNKKETEQDLILEIVSEEAISSDSDSDNGQDEECCYDL